MPQWDHPYHPPYSIYQCERPYDQAPLLTRCKLREPLKSLDHIRLLKIYPPGWPDRLTEKVTREDDPAIQCDAFQVALANVTTKKRPYFATLSYSWGHFGAKRKIRCGKERISITLNLYEALVFIRNLKTPRLLWVDSLCINQSDELEKSHQVQRMHLIYGQSHCISWLGIEPEDRDDLQSMLPLLRWFSDTEETFYRRSWRITWKAVDEYLEHQPVLGFRNLRQIPWETLHRCMERDAFGRLWCVQEILIARSNDLRTSKSHLDIAVLARSANIIRGILQDLSWSLKFADDTLGDIRYPIDRTESFRLLCRGIARMLLTAPLPCLEFKKHCPVEHTPALSVVTDYLDKECSNPRDHVYGLAALCDLGTSYQISYAAASLTVHDVFADFTLHCIHTTKSLDAFRYTFRNTAVRRGGTLELDLTHRTWTPGLPSWCTDLAGPRPLIRNIMDMQSNRNYPLRACKGRPARLTTLSRQELGVAGMQIGVVQTCSSVWRGARITKVVNESSSYKWNHMASVQKCMASAAIFVPAKSLWKLYLDVSSTGLDWRRAPPWPGIAHNFPAKTRDRMVKSSIGVAWLMYHLPELALMVGLSQNRSLPPISWSLVAHDVDNWIYNLNLGTRLFTTDNDRAILGTGPEGLCVGDVVCVLFGGDVPFILRPNSGGQYTLIGECYVSGIMRGEALGMGLEEREFVLV